MKAADKLVVIDEMVAVHVGDIEAMDIPYHERLYVLALTLTRLAALEANRYGASTSLAAMSGANAIPTYVQALLEQNLQRRAKQ